MKNVIIFMACTIFVITLIALTTFINVDFPEDGKIMRDSKNNYYHVSPLFGNLYTVEYLPNYNKKNSPTSLK